MGGARLPAGGAKPSVGGARLSVGGARPLVGGVRAISRSCEFLPQVATRSHRREQLCSTHFCLYNRPILHSSCGLCCRPPVLQLSWRPLPMWAIRGLPRPDSDDRAQPRGHLPPVMPGDFPSSCFSRASIAPLSPLSAKPQMQFASIESKYAKAKGRLRYLFCERTSKQEATDTGALTGAHWGSLLGPPPQCSIL